VTIESILRWSNVRAWLNAHLSMVTWLIFVVAVCHRALQWLLLEPALKVLIQNNPDFQVMQLLPRSLWQSNFAEALLYLQQSPPIPNIIFAVVCIFTPDPLHQAAALTLFEGLLHAISSALIFRLLMRFSISLPISLTVSVLFIVNIDFLVAEYSAFGQLFYEQMAMCLCLCAASCATSLARKPSAWIAFVFGVTIAGLALTRASFSYFFIPAAVWFICMAFCTASGNRQWLRLSVLFLLPIVIVHGGWAAKQFWVQGQFSWATSSWGGLNIQAGDLKRFFATKARQTDSGNANTDAIPSALAMDVACLSRWQHIKPLGFFAINQLLGTHPDNAGPTPQALTIDRNSTQARDMSVAADSAVVREYSQCVQKAYFALWLSHPNQLLASWWQSYGLFWDAISDFAEIYPITLIPEHKRGDKPGTTLAWQPGGDIFASRNFMIRQDTFPFFSTVYDASAMRPVTLLALPVLPALFSTLAMVLLHSAPLVYLLLRRRNNNNNNNNNNNAVNTAYAGISFLVLTYLYVAVVSSIGEHGENMRFRVVVEPLVWCIAAVVLTEIQRLTCASSKA